MSGNQAIAQIDQLLAATQDAALWPEALRTLATDFNAEHAFAYLVSPAGVDAFTSRGSEEIVEDVIAGRWHERNPRMLRGLEFARRGPVGLLTDWRLFSQEEIAADAFEQEWAVRNQCVHYAGTFVPFASDAFLVLSIERGADRGRYLGSELDDITRTVLSVRDSLSFALRGQARLAEDLVDSLSVGGKAHAWVDGFGRIQHWSTGFDSLVGRFVDVRNGVIAPLRGAQDLLSQLIDRAARGEQVNLRVELRNPDDDNDSAFATALPLRTAASRITPRSDVLLSIEVKPVRSATLSAMLKENFQLTPAEIRLALHLNEGAVLRDAANIERITYETARTRLQVIFSKLGVGRQSELIRLLQRF